MRNTFSKAVLILVDKYHSEEWELYELGAKLYDLDMDSNGIFGAFEDAHTQLEGEWIKENGLEWSDELQTYLDSSGEQYGEYEGPYGSNDWRDLYEYFAQNVLDRLALAPNQVKVGIRLLGGAQ